MIDDYALVQDHRSSSAQKLSLGLSLFINVRLALQLGTDTMCRILIS